DISFDDVGTFLEDLDVFLFSRGKVVDDFHRLAATQQFFDNMRPNETASARYHIHCHPRTSRITLLLSSGPPASHSWYTASRPPCWPLAGPPTPSDIGILGWRQADCKPNSVRPCERGDHSSRPQVSLKLEQPTRKLRRAVAGARKRRVPLFGLAPCGVYQA